MDGRSMEGSADKGSAGQVDVDGLLYEVFVAPRQRTRYIDDEGEVRWGLIDAVWVEPLGGPARSSYKSRGSLDSACQATPSHLA
jgi:hypothetical protein